MIQTSTETKGTINIHDVLSVKQEVLKATRMDEAEWFAMMFDYGYEFAERFCKQFNNPRYCFYNLVQVKTQGKAGNFFWNWWRFKWLLHDKDWLINEAYSGIMVNYHNCKQHLLNDKQLVQELLEDLDTKTV
jgi:hypothetical protein